MPAQPQVFLAGEFRDRDTVTALLKAAGARILTRPPVSVGMEQYDSKPTAASKTSVILCEGCLIKQRIAGMQHVNTAWLLDTASAFDVQPLANYSI